MSLLPNQLKCNSTYKALDIYTVRLPVRAAYWLGFAGTV